MSGHAAVSADVDGSPRTVRRGAALREAFREAWPALAAYAGVRVFGLLVLAVFAWRADQSVLGLLGEWDGGWYVGIAEHGYDTGIRYDAEGLVNTNVAFFPLFPALIWLVSLVGIPATVAGVLVASVAGVAAAWGIFTIGLKLHSRAVGVLLAVLWGALPHAIVENMIYTESLFTALAAWALWAVLERRWLLAGGLTILAGLTRPTAAALIVAVLVACALAVRRREDGWRPWAAAAMAPLGLLGYLLWCAVALGRADAYFWMQNEGWGMRTDLGRDLIHEIGVTATHERPLAIYMTTLVLGVAALLLVLLVAQRQTPLPLIVFSALILLFALVQGVLYYYAKARFLIPAFPLLLPLALGLHRTSPLVRRLVLAGLIALSAWYGTYLTIVWVWSP